MFFFNDTATTEIYTLSLHDALPICPAPTRPRPLLAPVPLQERDSTQNLRQFYRGSPGLASFKRCPKASRSEEHTPELQSRQYLVCRLLLEKKKTGQFPSPHRPLYLP